MATTRAYRSTRREHHAIREPSIEELQAEVDGWQFLRLGFQPGNHPRYFGLDHMDHLEIGDTRLVMRWGHAGNVGRLPVARRPYARRTVRRFVEDVPPLSAEELCGMGVAFEYLPFAGQPGRKGRGVWRCPQCGKRARHLYLYDLVTVQEASPEVYTASAACRTCAKLEYKSGYTGRTLITSERIAEARTRGPRGCTRLAHLAHDRNLEDAAHKVAARWQRWEHQWYAAMDAWIAWHYLNALRLALRVARMQLAEAQTQERQARHAEVVTWQQRVQVAQADFQAARARYHELARKAA